MMMGCEPEKMTLVKRDRWKVFGFCVVLVTLQFADSFGSGQENCSGVDKSREQQSTELYRILKKRTRNTVPFDNDLVGRSSINQTGTFIPCGVTDYDTRITRNDVGRAQSEGGFIVPSCGYTTCDDPDLIGGYVSTNAQNLIENRTARMRIITLSNDDGTNIPITSSQTQTQMNYFNQYYKPIGLSFTATTSVLNSTFLRSGKITPYGCPISLIANKVMNGDCFFKENDYDGGDFVCKNPSTCNTICTYDNIMNDVSGTQYCTCVCVPYHRCTSAMNGNGVCDDDCNHAATNFDGGDCCKTPTDGTCRDYRLPMTKRSFADVTELRGYFNVDHSQEFVVIVATLPVDGLAGIAVFPWENTLSNPQYGGCTIGAPFWGVNAQYLLYGSVAVHETGHVLGLRHVHAGVTEVSGCQDSCFESQPSIGSPSSMLKGDLCSDTRPTPVNFYCRDPSPCGLSKSLNCQDCLSKSWTSTPFTNVMGYANQPTACLTKVFSPQQLARMRCYYEMYFSGWSGQTTPGIIPLAPTVTVSRGSVSIKWISPVNKGVGGISYTIERSSATSRVNLTTTKDTSFTDSTIQPSTTYSYRVISSTPSGSADYFSMESSATTLDPPSNTQTRTQSPSRSKSQIPSKTRPPSASKKRTKTKQQTKRTRTKRHTNSQAIRNPPTHTSNVAHHNNTNHGSSAQSHHMRYQGHFICSLLVAFVVCIAFTF